MTRWAFKGQGRRIGTVQNEGAQAASSECRSLTLADVDEERALSLADCLVQKGLHRLACEHRHPVKPRKVIDSSSTHTSVCESCMYCRSRGGEEDEQRKVTCRSLGAGEADKAELQGEAGQHVVVHRFAVKPQDLHKPSTARHL